MLALSFILADGVTIQLGGHIWTFGLNFLMYLLVAAIVGLIAEAIVGWRLPFGFIGAIIAALIGVWLLTSVIVITGIGDITVFGVHLLSALVDGIIVVGACHLLAYRESQR